MIRIQRISEIRSQYGIRTECAASCDGPYLQEESAGKVSLVLPDSGMLAAVNGHFAESGAPLRTGDLVRIWNEGGEGLEACRLSGASAYMEIQSDGDHADPFTGLSINGPAVRCLKCPEQRVYARATVEANKHCNCGNSLVGEGEDAPMPASLL